MPNSPESSLSENKVSDELLVKFSQKATQITCTPSELLFQQGDPPEAVYLVRAGKVGLTMPVSAKRALIFYAEPGSLVGLPAVFSNAPYSMTAIASLGTRLERLDRQPFWELLIENPRLALQVLQILADETRAARFALYEGPERRSDTHRKAD